MWGAMQYIGASAAFTALLSAPTASVPSVNLYGYRYQPVDANDARLAHMVVPSRRLAPLNNPVPALTSAESRLTQRVGHPTVVIHGRGSRPAVAICGNVVTHIRS